jgi:hypothetical protein
MEDVNGCTTNCSHCGVLLLIEDGVAYNFNKKLHEKDSRWPIDGKDTGFLSIKEENK